MRAVIFIDKHGFKRRSLVRDEDGDEMAEYGVPAGPPDLSVLDCDMMLKEINNILVDNGLFTWEDMQTKPIAVNIITNVVKRRLNVIFKESARIEKHGSL